MNTAILSRLSPSLCLLGMDTSTESILQCHVRLAKRHRSSKRLTSLGESPFAVEVAAPSAASAQRGAERNESARRPTEERSKIQLIDVGPNPQFATAEGSVSSSDARSSAAKGQGRSVKAQRSQGSVCDVEAGS